MKRKFGMVLLGVSLLLLPGIPCLAEETLSVSGWALVDVSEGEKYGIYPLEWYEDSVKKVITQDKLNTLYEGVEKKLNEAELEKNQKVEDVEGTTRGDVIRALYNQLAQYGEVVHKLNPENLNAIAYFESKGYVKGTNKGLELEQTCTIEQAIVLATHLIEGTYAELGKGSEGLAYKITSDNNTVYILGSVHIGSYEMYPINSNLKQAFDDSEALFVEADLFNPQKGMETYLEKAQYHDGTSLKDHISNETYIKTVEALEKYKLPVDTYNQFKPWCVAGDLTSFALVDNQKNQELGTSSILGVDRYFLEQAYFTGKQVDELEGIAYQADLFNGLSAEIQEEYLLQAVEVALQPEEGSSDESNLALDMQQYWRDGEYEKFVSDYTAALGKDSDEFSTMLLGKRDIDMADKIGKLLENEGNHTYFVVIGAAHVIMPDMTVDKLREKGYSVERFK